MTVKYGATNRFDKDNYPEYLMPSQSALTSVHFRNRAPRERH